jgi:hypothetical protein
VITHDQAIERLVRVRERLRLPQVASAFVASLTSAPGRYRTGLASFATAAHLEPHPLRPYATVPKPRIARCSECGALARE